MICITRAFIQSKQKLPESLETKWLDQFFVAGETIYGYHLAWTRRDAPSILKKNVWMLTGVVKELTCFRSWRCNWGHYSSDSSRNSCDFTKKYSTSCCRIPLVVWLDVCGAIFRRLLLTVFLYFCWIKTIFDFPVYWIMQLLLYNPNRKYQIWTWVEVTE